MFIRPVMEPSDIVTRLTICWLFQLRVVRFSHRCRRPSDSSQLRPTAASPPDIPHQHDQRIPLTADESKQTRWHQKLPRLLCHLLEAPRLCLSITVMVMMVRRVSSALADSSCALPVMASLAAWMAGLSAPVLRGDATAMEVFIFMGERRGRGEIDR